MKHGTPGPGQYTLKSTVANLTPCAKIGHSQRKNFFRLNDSPGPGTYYTDKGHARIGASFGKARRALATRKSSVPGPGSYSTGAAGRKDSRLSLCPRRADRTPKQGEASPGPAAYEIRCRRNSPAFSIRGRLKLPKSRVGIGQSPGVYSPQYNLLRKSPPYWRICANQRNIKISSGDGPDPAAYKLPALLGEGPKISFHGVGSKTRAETGPGPGAYDPRHELVLEKVQRIVVCAEQRKDFGRRRDIPGPGAYPVGSTLNGPKFGFGAEKRSLYRLDQSTPGPGRYKIPAIIGRAESYQLPRRKSQSESDDL
eukprot:TRINITY_DN889_c0_g3_i4.p1 TRINITY_DN889_c0_g3~~TRINITY_DN889_c0_g3_i4.p1  ORF type:complete len:311 (-),score=21.29 TRINITY_DN889_c0_g3_i4:71-1003(-)